MKAHQAIDLLRDAAAMEARNPLRRGQLVHLPQEGELVVSGDLHNHRRNFERIVSLAALEAFPARHVLLQELIHGGALGAHGEDNSMELLLEAIQWARQFPGRVHFLLSNHDWAQVFGIPAMKEGLDLTERFNMALRLHYGARAGDAAAALREYALSLPLACITVNGIMLSHSLPGPTDMPHFDPAILTRQLDPEDYARNSSVYRMVWGRHQNRAVVDRLAKAWFTDIFICGHQPCEQGFRHLAEKIFLIDSSHNHGALAVINLARQYTLESLSQCAIPLAAIA